MTAPSLRDVTHVSFDADGTLWNFDKVMWEALEASRSEILMRYPDARVLTVQRLRQIRDEVASDGTCRGCSHEEIRLRAFSRALEEIGRPDLDFAVRLTRRYLDFRFSRAELYPDVKPMLQILAGRLRIGLVSNGNSDPERCGLPDTFSFQVFSSEHGVAKPDPRIFRIALKQTGCSPGRLLHIGDSLVDDVACPQTLGIRTVWLNRSREPRPDSYHPDFIVESLSELRSLLSLSLDRVAV